MNIQKPVSYLLNICHLIQQANRSFFRDFYSDALIFSLIFLSISVCLLIAVFRSLQQSHSSTVVFCDKAVPQTSLSYGDRKNKRYKIPFKIWLAILRVTSYSLEWTFVNVIQDIILIFDSLRSKLIVSVAKRSVVKQFSTMFVLSVFLF